MTVLNLTQHQASAEQIEAGVVDLPPQYREELIKLLTFDDLPDEWEVNNRAMSIALIAGRVSSDLGYSKEAYTVRPDCMIGGAPFFMAPLERALNRQGFAPVYAFSRRESVEEVQADGSIRKVAVFRHLGFVRP